MSEIDKYTMELPLDADDVPIRVGDVMRNKFTGAEYEVEAVGVGCFFAWRDAACRYVQLDADAHVHRKRELEDVLRDFLDGAFAAQAMFVAESMDSDEYNSELERITEKAVEEIRGRCMGRDEMTRVLRRMVDTLPDVETDICTEIGRAVDEIAGRMW